MATYDNKLLDGEHLVYFAQKVKSSINAKQDAITSSNKLDYALLDNAPTIPSALSGLTQDATHRVVSDTEKTTWNGKQDALVFNTAYNASSNKVATMSDITSAIGGLTGFHFEIVQTLPATGDASAIYLVLKSSGISGNVPLMMKKTMDLMTDATGVDMAEVLKTNTLAAKTDRNIKINNEESGDPQEPAVVIK
jgi:hypothetical protein